MAKKAKVPVITVEQERKLLLKPCKTRDELKAWIKYFLNLSLPDVTVSRYSDTNPLDVIWEVYDICVNTNNPENIKELLFVAGRGSGKCSIKDTVILTNSGPKYIQNINVSDRVWTGWSWQPVVQTFDEGVKAGVKITTNVGKHSGSFSMTGSLKHRIQAVNEKNLVDWVFMKDLKPGQLIYKSDQSSFNVDVTSTDYEKGWIIGTITGDGCVSRHGNNINICGSDFNQLKHYTSLVHKFFSIKHGVKRTSKKSVTVGVSSKDFKKWYSSFISGELSYYKKLISLEHSPDFLAGFISGLMETDGSKDSICLANIELIEQISQIFTIFGVHSKINLNSRKPRYSQFIKENVTYGLCEWKSKLPEFLMPIFSKRQAFVDYSNKMNEQFRYPSVLIRPFAEHIKDKYEIANGYWRLSPGKKTRSNIKYSKDLWGTGEKSKENYIYGYKIDNFIELAKQLGEQEWVEKFQFIRSGYFEKVNTVDFGQHYFYDLEVAVDHSYWSNGFISHNTLGMAIAELMVLLHDKREVVHVGAIQNQAERCYAYQKNFLYNRKLKRLVTPNDIPEDQRILEKANMSKSLFNIGGEKLTLEVIPCTLKACNGPHVPLLVVDEIDTVSGEGVKAFKEISGMLDSRNGKKALRVGISTRKSRYGLMNKQIENAVEENRTVRRWTAFEFMERCDDERSGTKKIPLWVNQDKMETLTEYEYNKKETVKQKDYTMYEGFEGCAKCPIFSICLTDAKKQTSTSPMLKNLDVDLIQKVKAEGADWALAQLMNLKPSVEGIIYREFEEKIHVKDWDQMWFALTGKEFPGECSHDMFVKKCHEMGLPCYAGIDWGYSSPNTVVFFFIDKRDNVYIVCTDGMTQISSPSWIHHIKTKYHLKYRVQLYVPDQADQGSIQEMQKAGLPVSNIAEKPQIMTGIQVIKKLLKVPGTTETKMFINEECQHIIKEFGLYHYKLDAAGIVTDIPNTDHDHWLDALRYPLTLLLGKTNIILGGGLDFDHGTNIRDPNGSFSRTPTAAEYAQANGIKFNENEQDVSKLGKIGSKAQLDDDSGDDSGSQGGFLWSF